MKPKSNITIARAIARLNVGGPAIQAILMTDAFRRKGYRTFLLCGEIPSGEGSMEYLAREKDVIPVKISDMSRRISWRKDLASLLKLVRILAREKPTVLHTHTAKAGTLGRLAAMATRVPIRVHTFHGHVFRGYFPPSVARAFLIIERFLARHTDCIVAISESQKRELVETYRIAPAEKVVVVPLGLDLDAFLSVRRSSGIFRDAIGCKPSSFLVGWVGRLTAIKDPSLFVNCAATAAPEIKNLHCVIVGDGEMRQRCEAQIKDAGLDSLLRIAGWRQDLPSVYADLDVVVSTSINEGTPVALLEAMACGKPFVATDVGGVRDLMVGSPRKQSSFEIFENGILAQRSPQSLADAITYLAQNQEVAGSMGAVGRNFVRDRFGSDRLADDLEGLYLSLASSKKVVRTEAVFEAMNDTPQCVPSEKAHS